MTELQGKINDVDEQSEFVKDVLDKQPSWMIRFGLFLFFGIVLLIFTFLYLIKYPDVLTANITLTTLNPPVKLLSKSNGKLTHLLVKNNEQLKINQTIAVIENTANYIDVLYLEKASGELLNKLKLIDSIPSITFKDSVKVGELTPYFLQFLKSIKDANLYKEINPYKRQTTLLQKDLLSYTDLLTKYRKQESINKEQLNLVERDYNRDKTLYESSAISAREYDNKKKEYLNALNSNEQVKITVSNALIQINAIEKNILQLQIQDYQEQAKLKNELSQNLKNLISEITKWKQLYLIQSPTNGRISFFNIWVVNQNITQGDELFSVIPSQKQEFIGKCILPILNTGKLQVGQKVNIKLDNYQYSEMGMLQGTVTNISEVPNKDTYAIDVKLDNGLITSYKKTLYYKEEMKGTADIITKNISVMDRILFNFRKLVDKK
jgi:multidrug efflux pump subunit AcrA (membrane-fusion protein)